MEQVNSPGATQKLKDDHKRVIGLFRELKTEVREGGSVGGDARSETLGRILEELEAHSEVEKHVYYPALREEAEKLSEPGVVGLVAKFFGDHAQVDAQVAALKEGREAASDEAIFKLISDVEAHISEEEELLFPEADNLLMGRESKIQEEMTAYARNQPPQGLKTQLRGEAANSSAESKTS